MFAIEVQHTFCAAHALRLPNGTLEPLHGHNFALTAKLSCHTLDPLETVLDFHIVERWLHAILAPWTNRNLNDLEPFATRINPSAERIAEQAGLALQEALHRDCPADASSRGLKLVEVRVTEAPNCIAIWSPGDNAPAPPASPPMPPSSPAPARPFGPPVRPIGSAFPSYPAARPSAPGGPSQAPRNPPSGSTSVP